MRTSFKLAVMFLFASALMMTGCKKEKPAEDKAAPADKKDDKKDKAGKTGIGAVDKLVDKVKDKVGEVDKLAKDGRKALSPEEYEKLMLALSSCELKKFGLDHKCPAYKEMKAARSRNTILKDFAGMSSKLGIKHLTHENATIRYWAAGLLKSFFGSKAGTQDAVLKAAPNEKNPIVLSKMVWAVGSSAKKNPKIAEFLMKMADHEADQVRIASIGWLNSSWGKDIKGGLDKVIEKIEKDPSDKVRQAACSGAGSSGDDRLVPIFKKYTKKPDDKPSLYSSCMRGLVKMWNPFLSRDSKSEKAYKLTMNRLNDKPRSRNRPPWIIMSDLGREPKGAPKWYKKKSMVKVLTVIALDEKANWMARTGATRSLGKLKAKPELEKIKKTLGAKDSFDNKQVVKNADKELAKL